MRKDEREEGSGANQVPPRVALVGRTNVGKSTLFNRLVGGRRALVAPTPGLTRDRREGTVRRDGVSFVLVDTGGLEFGSNAPFSQEIAQQVGVAIQGSDAIWLVLDGADGVSPLDLELHRWLIRQGKPMLAIVNKIDNARRGGEMVEFYALGVEALYPVSAIHGSGIADLLGATEAVLPAIGSLGADRAGLIGNQEPIRVALVGKPNVGKSSLVNAILGEARMIVSEVAGTTREPVDVAIERAGRRYSLIDTAGIRRRARTHDPIEKISALTAIGSLERCEVAVLVLDAEQGVADQDAKIASYIVAHKRAAVVALNKWDRLADDCLRGREMMLDVQHRLSFLDYAPIVRVSAVHGEGIQQLFHEVQRAHTQFTREIQTADLNRVVEISTRHQAPPMVGRSATRVYYGTQIKARPPTFRFFTNHRERVEGGYTRFLVNQIRYHFGMQGTPIEIVWSGKAAAAHAPSPGKHKKPPASPPKRPPERKRRASVAMGKRRKALA